MLLISEVTRMILLDNSVIIKLLQLVLQCSLYFFTKTLNPCFILDWVMMVLFVMILVSGVVSTKVAIALTTLT